MKLKSIIKLLAFSFVVTITTSCLDGNKPNLPGGGETIVTMTYQTGSGTSNQNSGLASAAFSACTLLFPSMDTTTMYVTMQGPALKKDVTITLVVDPSKLADNYANDGLTYVLLPDSAYSFIDGTTATIKAGQTYASFRLAVDPDQIDGSQNYMLPVTTTNNADLTVAQNVGTVYVHTIGNPLVAVGQMSQDTRLWLAADTTGTPADEYNTWVDPSDGAYIGWSAVSFSPLSSTQVVIPEGYLGINFYITFVYDKSTNTYSKWKASFSDDDVESYAESGLTVIQPTIITADPVNGVFEFQSGYINAKGTRTLVDKFVKQ